MTYHPSILQLVLSPQRGKMDPNNWHSKQDVYVMSATTGGLISCFGLLTGFAASGELVVLTCVAVRGTRSVLLSTGCGFYLPKLVVSIVGI